MKKFAPLFIVFSAILWGLDGIILTPQLFSLPVPLVVFLNHALAFIFMLPFFIFEFKEVKKITAGDWGTFFWIAVFGGAVGTMAIVKALFYVNFVNLSIVILLQKLQPVFAIFLAWLLLNEKLPKKFFIWAAVALVGGYFVTFGASLPSLATGEKTVAAALFSLLAAFAFGSSTVFGKRVLKSVNYRLSTYLRFGLTAVLMLVFVFFTGDLFKINQVTSHQLLIFLIIVFTTGGLAILFYYYGLKYVSASVSTILELAFPLSAILFEYLLRHNVLSWVQWLGVLILGYGIYKVSSLSRRSETSPAFVN